jgi:hypothetical protein
VATRIFHILHDRITHLEGFVKRGLQALSRETGLTIAMRRDLRNNNRRRISLALIPFVYGEDLREDARVYFSGLLFQSIFTSMVLVEKNDKNRQTKVPDWLVEEKSRGQIRGPGPWCAVMGLFIQNFATLQPQAV